MHSAAKHELADTGSTNKANILVVDDHPDKVLVLQTILEELNENVVVANSGKEALKLMLEMEFAVILLDVKMPEMDGFETASLIRGRRRFAHTPIIFVTAYADEMHTSEGYSLGAVDYILTPIVPEILRTKVSVFVQLFHMTNSIRQHAEERIALVREQAARAAAEEAIRRSTFLAEASQVLSSSLAVEETLTGLTRFAVPYLGDLCAVVLLDDSGETCQTQLAWTAGRDGSIAIRQATVVRLRDEKIAEMLALSLGRSEFQMLDLGNEKIALAADNGGVSQALLPLGFALGKLAIFPLLARGRQLGALLVGASTSRIFSSADLAVTSDLAGRTAIALDNALLYSKIQSDDQRKDEFLAMLAHELRNPLAAIKYANQLAKIQGRAEDETEEIIDRQVTNLAHLIDDLLDVSRITRDKIQLQREMIDASTLVDRAVATVKQTVDARQQSFSVDCSKDPMPLDVDSTRIEQIFANLLSNAAKYTPEGGTIAVRCFRQDGQAVFQVRDSGVGIPSDMLPRVFDLFTQVDKSLDRSQGGLGIGLTVARKLAEMHGGSVTAKSEGLGSGSEFTVRLPISDKTLETKAPAAPVMRGSAPRKILVVDDNLDTARSIAALLRRAGHEVEIAHDGPTALKVARDFQPEAILLDIGLPIIDGYRVAETLRRESAFAKVLLIAISGYGQADDRKRSRAAGFDDHLIKPVDFRELLRILSESPAR